MEGKDFDWNQVEKLSYVLLRGAGEAGALGEHYDAAYQLWRAVWAETFRELEGEAEIFSDNFTRQDHIGALFDGPRCLMMSFFRRTNIATLAAREDSYFKVWTPEALNGLARDGSDVIVASNITLHPEVRGKNFFLPMKDLVLSLAVRYLVASDADAMTGTTRNNKGVNGACLRNHAQLLLSDCRLHNVSVDLMAFYARDIRAQRERHLQPLTDYLWENRLSWERPRKWLKAA